MSAPPGTTRKKPHSSGQDEEAQAISAEGERLVHERTQELRKENEALRREIDTIKRTGEWFEKAFYESPVALLMATLHDGRFVAVNECFLQTFGYSREEVIGRTSTELNLYADADADAYARIVRVAREQGNARNYDLTSRTRTGGLIHVLLSTDIIHAHGQEYALSTLIEIAGRRRIEPEREDLLRKVQASAGKLEAANEELRATTEELAASNEVLRRQREELVTVNRVLRESERNASEILESIRDGFFSLDRNWTFTYINQRAAENVGRTREYLALKNIWKEFPEIQNTEMGSVFRQVMLDRRPRRFEQWGVLTDKLYEIRVYPGSEGGISVYWLDITARKQAEEALRELNGNTGNSSAMRRRGSTRLISGTRDLPR